MDLKFGMVVHKGNLQLELTSNITSDFSMTSASEVKNLKQP